MRTKEDAQDYRYFPDPDLPPLAIDNAWIERIRAEMPELPEARKARYQKDYALSPYDATLLTADVATASYFEATAKALAEGLDLAAVIPEIAKTVATWVLGDVAAALHRTDIEMARSPIAADELAWLLRLVVDGTISAKIAREQVFPNMWERNRAADLSGLPHPITAVGAGSLPALVAEMGWEQISDAGALEKIVDDVIAANAPIVAEYKAGKGKAFNSLIGKVMAATKGKANPAQVNAILRKKLGA
jgi:aspartyl-tRNA(Asn)/glutamyl-tRNA(Gln) amidotransferase subunit B